MVALCVCAIGYTGQLCDTDVDECLENPCLNGATCLNLNGSFECVWPLKKQDSCVMQR